METIIEIAVIICTAVSVTTAIYHLIPFRTLAKTKPRIAFFPKYVQRFSIPVGEVTKRIEEKGFVARQKTSTEFDRGKIYGDFSAKLMKLRIRLEEDKKCIKIFAPFFGVLFDNGDLWGIANDITIHEKP